MRNIGKRPESSIRLYVMGTASIGSHPKLGTGLEYALEIRLKSGLLVNSPILPKCTHLWSHPRLILSLKGTRYSTPNLFDDKSSLRTLRSLQNTLSLQTENFPPLSVTFQALKFKWKPNNPIFRYANSIKFINFAPFIYLWETFFGVKNRKQKCKF